MEKYLILKEDTRFYRGDIEVMESKANPGMVLIQLWMKDIENGDRDSAGIRLTRDQARQVANHLNALADQLFFEEQRPMRDFVGNELKEGDDVAFTEYNRHALTRGTVKGFSKGMGMVIVEYSHYGETRTTKKTSDYVIKVAK